MFKWFTSSKNKENESNPLPSEGAITSVGSDEEPCILAVVTESSDRLEQELKLMAKRNSQLEEHLKLRDVQIDALQERLKKQEADILSKKCKSCAEARKLEKTHREMRVLENECSKLKTSNAQQEKYINRLNYEIRELTVETNNIEKPQSELPADGLNASDPLFKQYQAWINNIKRFGGNSKSQLELLTRLSKQQAFFMAEKHKVESTRLKVEKERNELEQKRENLESVYSNYEYLLRNRVRINAKAAKLRYYEEKIMKEFNEKESLIDDYLNKEEELNSLKEQLHQKEKQFEREQKWLKREEAQMKKQEAQMYEYSVSVQRKLYEKIEKDEQVLFIIRSLEAVSPVYEQVITNLVSCLKSGRLQYIVFSYMLGKSIYEIAQDLDIPAVNVKRTYMLAIDKIRKRLCK